MGARHLTCVVLDGETKVAQYGQWDGYPSHAGANVIKFLESANMDDFTKAIQACTVATDEQVEQICADQGSTPAEYSRDTGTDILQLILNKGGLPLVLNEEFAASGLFCEWAYVVDLDNNTLEIYEGFKKTPQENRFSKFGEKDDEYAPVHLIETYAFNAMPDPEDLETDLFGEPEEEEQAG